MHKNEICPECPDILCYHVCVDLRLLHIFLRLVQRRCFYLLSSGAAICGKEYAQVQLLLAAPFPFPYRFQRWRRYFCTKIQAGGDGGQ